MPDVVLFLLLCLRQATQEGVVEQLARVYLAPLELLALGAVRPLALDGRARVIVAQGAVVAAICCLLLRKGREAGLLAAAGLIMPVVV